MIRTNTHHGLGTTTSLLPPSAVRLGAFTRTGRHLRALLRVSRRRPSFALGFLLAAGSALTTATVVLSSVSSHRATVEPLAPPPAPPMLPLEALQSHHLFPKLNFPELARINPLRGLASWYGDVWNGRKTASGETFDETKLTAAHKTLPLGTIVRVTNLASSQSVIVKINDRGTLSPHRVIDLSSAAARQIGILDAGLARVKLEVVGRL